MEYKGFTLKYYTGGTDNPYVGMNQNSALWWEGERAFYEAVSTPDGGEFLSRLEEWFDKAEREGHLSGRLVDAAIPKKERLLVFFLDLWHGKNFPYDDLDEINKY